MTPPLTKKQKELLNETYEKVLGGRDKLYKFLQEHHPNSNISRRQVMEWLKGQELNQITTTPRKTVKIVSITLRFLGNNILDQVENSQRKLRSSNKMKNLENKIKNLENKIRSWF